MGNPLLPFSVTTIAGGHIDAIRKLPFPHYSKKGIPYVRGRQVDVLAEATVFSDSYTLPYDAEFLSIAFAASEYGVGDYWELTVGGEKICETIYAKTIPEGIGAGKGFGLVYPVPADTEIKFEFYNTTGTAKTVWYNMKFVR